MRRNPISVVRALLTPPMILVPLAALSCALAVFVGCAGEKADRSDSKGPTIAGTPEGLDTLSLLRAPVLDQPRVLTVQPNEPGGEPSGVMGRAVPPRDVLAEGATLSLKPQSAGRSASASAPAPAGGPPNAKPAGPPMADAPPPAADPSPGGRGPRGGGGANGESGTGGPEHRKDAGGGDSNLAQNITQVPGGALDKAAEVRRAVEQAAASRSLRAMIDFPGSRPRESDEVWVIQRAPAPARAQGDELPGTGSMVTTIPDPARPGATTRVPVPLAHTDVKASIVGNLATVGVTQQFHNPFDSKIEAVYVFPLPEDAAVSEFVMTIGERTIRGIIRDREEARRTYDAAKAQGYTAALLEQERPNIFTQSVANIEPGKRIDITITYFGTLAFVDGAFEFTFPMVVGPRFNPPGFYAGVGAAARGSSPDASGQPVQVPYLKPGERSGHDIAISVDIKPGMAIERVTCESHVAEISMGEPVFAGGRSRPPSVLEARARLSPRDAIPNKDFVLRVHVASDRLRSGIVTGTDRDGRAYFNLLLVPPAEPATLSRAPVELVFVIDSSGSMNGWPIRQAVAAVERGLRRLDERDTFQIINFSSTVSALGPAPLPATAENIERGLEHARRVSAEGGTYMLNGLRAALEFPADPTRLRFVCFLTDGYIGNESEIIGELHARLGSARVFSFGVGSSVNRYLIDAMGKVGRGCVAHVAAGDSVEQIMDRFFDRISRPALTDVRIQAGAVQVEEMYPRRLPDVFAGRALVVSGRLAPGATLSGAGLRVVGNAGGKRVEFEVPVRAEGAESIPSNPALAKVWARAKLADLADHASAPAVQETLGQIREIALTHGLMSAFTSFVAVDSLAPTAGQFGTTVAVPVPMPEGVQYRTTVPER